jgi:lipase ATG15
MTITTTPAPAPNVTTTSSTPTSTSSCKYPGWFGGCLDGDDPPAKTHHTPKPTPTATSASTSCTSEGFFGLICYDKSKKHGKTSSNPPVTERMEM